VKWVGDSCEVTPVIATLEVGALSSETLLLSASKYSLFYEVLLTKKEFSKQ